MTLEIRSVYSREHGLRYEVRHLGTVPTLLCTCRNYRSARRMLTRYARKG